MFSYQHVDAPTILAPLRDIWARYAIKRSCNWCSIAVHIAHQRTQFTPLAGNQVETIQACALFAYILRTYQHSRASIRRPGVANKSQRAIANTARLTCLALNGPQIVDKGAILLMSTKHTNLLTIRGPVWLAVIEVPGSEATSLCRISGIITSGGWHHEKMIELLKEATSIETIPDICNRAQAKVLLVLTLLPRLLIKRLTPHEHLVVVCRGRSCREGNPVPIKRPGRLAHSIEHCRQLTRLAAISIYQPELAFVVFTIRDKY